MTVDIPLRCRCGALRGVATAVSPTSGSRVICYCDDCQAFARRLGQEGIVDAKGGTDLFQMTPSQLRIAEGAEQIRCLRLSPKGLLRWYAGCCRTPIGNTAGSAELPFVGVVHSFMDHAADGRARDNVLGAPIARFFGGDAIGGAPEGSHPKAPLRYIGRMALSLVRARLAGKHRPSPFFDEHTGRPRVEPEVLTTAERDGLRAS